MVSRHLKHWLIIYLSLFLDPSQSLYKDMKRLFYNGSDVYDQYIAFVESDDSFSDENVWQRLIDLFVQEAQIPFTVIRLNQNCRIDKPRDSTIVLFGLGEAERCFLSNQSSASLAENNWMIVTFDRLEQGNVSDLMGFMKDLLRLDSQLYVLTGSSMYEVYKVSSAASFTTVTQVDLNRGVWERRKDLMGARINVGHVHNPAVETNVSGAQLKSR